MAPVTRSRTKMLAPIPEDIEDVVTDTDTGSSTDTTDTSTDNEELTGVTLVGVTGSIVRTTRRRRPDLSDEEHRERRLAQRRAHNKKCAERKGTVSREMRNKFRTELAQLDYYFKLRESHTPTPHAARRAARQAIADEYGLPIPYKYYRKREPRASASSAGAATSGG